MDLHQHNIEKQLLFESAGFYGKAWSFHYINSLMKFSGIGKFRPKKFISLSYNLAFKAICDQTHICRFYSYQVWPIFSKSNDTIVAICGFTPIPEKLRTSVYLEIEILDEYKKMENICEIIEMVVAYGKKYCEIRKIYRKDTQDPLYINVFKYLKTPKISPRKI